MLQILVLGIYRANTGENQAPLPYVRICPDKESLLSANDKLFVYCNPFILAQVLNPASDTVDSFYGEISSDSENAISACSRMGIDSFSITLC